MTGMAERFDSIIASGVDEGNESCLSSKETLISLVFPGFS